MKIIASISDPAVIRRILTQFGLWREREGTECDTAPVEELVPHAGLLGFLLLGIAGGAF